MTKLSTTSIAAAVLTGGKSSRMGRDKSLLRFEGRTLTARSVEKLVAAGFSPVFVVGPPKRYGISKSIAVISERARGKGPLSGIEAALRHASSACLVLPCDLPFLSVRALKHLKKSFQKPCTAFRGHPLPAIFDFDILTQVQKNLRSQKLAIYPLLNRATFLDLGRSRALFNLNDLKSLLSLEKPSKK